LGGHPYIIDFGNVHIIKEPGLPLNPLDPFPLIFVMKAEYFFPLKETYGFSLTLPLLVWVHKGTTSSLKRKDLKET
jgi:hypothetical protein